MKIKIAYFLIILGIFTGCGFKQDTVQIKYYTVLVPAVGVKEYKPIFPSLEVRRVQVSPLYRDNSIVYLLPGNEVLQDFYNKYFSSPAELVTQSLFMNIKKSNITKQAFLSKSLLYSRYQLETYISDFYADFSEDKKDVVVTILFKVIDINTASNTSLFTKEYTKRKAIKNSDPSNVVGGIEKMLAEIYAELLEDLSKNIKIKA